MCLKAHWILTNNYFDRRTNNWNVLGPSSIFFPDRCTLKFLEMKCNPANKKNLWPKSSAFYSLIQVATVSADFVQQWHPIKLVELLPAHDKL